MRIEQNKQNKKIWKMCILVIYNYKKTSEDEASTSVPETGAIKEKPGTWCWDS